MPLIEHNIILSVANVLFAVGAEIYIRDPSYYRLDCDNSQPLAFADIAEAARQQKETALGYILRDGAVISAPHANDKQKLHIGDRIIALADQT